MGYIFNESFDKKKKQKIVDLMNSARDPLKKHETLFQKKKKKKGEMQIADTGHDCYIQMDI